MPGLPDITFVSSNAHKAGEVRRILHQMGIDVGVRTADISEIQHDSLDRIAAAKAVAARDAIGGPAFVEDDGLFIDSLRGFPGPYSSYVFDTIGNAGILRLVTGPRTAVFKAVIAYSDYTDSDTLLFTGETRGVISDESRGVGWGYDPIFIPDGASGTFAQIEKDLYSHRQAALGLFAEWLQNLPKDADMSGHLRDT